MMQERDRLATNLLKKGTFRSSLGLSVLQDLISLFSKTSEVSHRLGLEPENCACPKVKAESEDYARKAS
jgi:hypothetical protein